MGAKGDLVAKVVVLLYKRTPQVTTGSSRYYRDREVGELIQRKVNGGLGSVACKIDRNRIALSCFLSLLWKSDLLLLLQLVKKLPALDCLWFSVGANPVKSFAEGGG